MISISFISFFVSVLVSEENISTWWDAFQSEVAFRVSGRIAYRTVAVRLVLCETYRHIRGAVSLRSDTAPGYLYVLPLPHHDVGWRLFASAHRYGLCLTEL